jgi:hypothetical protein
VFLGLVVVGVTDMFFTGATDNPVEEGQEPLIEDRYNI